MDEPAEIPRKTVALDAVGRDRPDETNDFVQLVACHSYEACFRTPFFHDAFGDWQIIDLIQLGPEYRTHLDYVCYLYISNRDENERVPTNEEQYHLSFVIVV